MRVSFKAVTDLPYFFFCISASAGLLLQSRPTCAQQSPPAPATPVEDMARVRWLADLGAESVAASSGPANKATGTAFVAAVPGAAYVLALEPDGSIRKKMRLAADPAAPYGVAATAKGLAVADTQGAVSLWTLAAGGDPSLRWRRELGDRVTSLGWDGGERVLAATWKGRLVALSSADGRSLWSTDIGGRAEAPGMVDGSTDVFVATKAKTLLRLDAATGAVRWKVALPGMARHPPILFGQRPRLVVCGTWEGQLLAYDPATGRLQWSAALPGKLVGAPLALPDAVAVVTAEGEVRGYDPSGRSSWTAQGAAEGPATLLWPASAGATSRLLSVSKLLTGLEVSTGTRAAGYPQGALDDLRRRFAEAMLEGVKTYSETEKRALQEKEAFEIAGPSFGPARTFGPYVAFGTEEGWAYLFDAATLHPIGRYHAGQPTTAAPRLLAGRVLAAAGEEVFALDLRTGQTLWKKTVGPEPGRITGEATLGVVAGERLHALSPSDGDVRWTLRGRFRSVAPPATGAEPAGTPAPWLVDDGEGNLRALQPPGRLIGEALPAGGELLPLLALTTRSWIAATREGKVFIVSWDEGRLVLVKGAESTVEGPIVEVQAAPGRVLVRSSAALLALDATSLQEAWRVPLSRDDRLQVLAEAGQVVVLGADDLRLHDAATGELKLQRKLASPAVGADLAGGRLRWLDRAGSAYQTDVPDGRAETTPLGLPLAEAVRAPGGFLVTTAAGEVEFVDVMDRGPATRTDGDAGAQPRGARR